ncbi:MAG: PRC-barrel domain-containing protein [Leptolyngbyaceae cyanobacterium MO_188.B28]|nr:PRC-barrel domain-containing protein [Leptolyngbyaceae cyanobacterium MO_188.B28]
MTTPLIKRSDLLGRLVIDQQTTEELGHINQLFVDTQSRQVAGISCKSGLLGRTVHLFKWVDINSIGADSVLINWYADASLEPSDAMNTMVDHELWTDSGNKVGGINDYLLNPETGQVTDYLFVSSGWQGLKEGSYRLPSDAVISVGRKRVIVKDEAVQSAEQFSEGLQDKLTQAVEFIKEDYAKTQADMTSLVEGAQTTASKLQTSAQQVATQAKGTAADVQGHLQTVVHKAAEQVQETAASVQKKVESAPSEESSASKKEVGET